MLITIMLSVVTSFRTECMSYMCKKVYRIIPLCGLRPLSAQNSPVAFVDTNHKIFFYGSKPKRILRLGWLFFKTFWAPFEKKLATAFVHF